MSINKIENIINQFDPIDLKQMDEVSLMKRVDKKFTLPIDKLLELLPVLSKNYKCLEINNNRIFTYSTEYFDTKDCKMFLAHQNEKQNRYKIRFRDYVESKLSFLEIKFKTNKSETIKKRIKVDFKDHSINELENKFISDHTIFNPKNIKSKLKNYFKRITLVSLKNKERVTIDFGLNFEGENKKNDQPLLAIIEVKKDKNNLYSEIFSMMKQIGIRDNNFSKYAIGSVLTNSDLKYNRFKERLIQLNKINKHGNIWDRAI